MSTTTHLEPELLQELVNLLTPYMATEAERRAILRLALPNTAYQLIDFYGPAKVFTTNMINTLLQYGEIASGQQAIVAVLNTVHDQVGTDKQRAIHQLSEQFEIHFQAATSAPKKAEVDKLSSVQSPATTPIEQYGRDIIFKDNQAVNITGDVINAGQVNKTTYIDLGGLAVAIETWLREIISPADIPDHLATSWAGRFIYIVRKLTAGIRPEHLWTLLVWLTLWVATNWLVGPILRWPLDNVTARGQAALLYALATLVIPLFVALISPVDRQAEMRLASHSDLVRFWFLKLIGAATGFALAAGTIGVAMVAYYLGGSLPRAVQWMLTLVPLLFSHIGARRIPGDRLKMYGELCIHAVDRLVVGVWLVLGPGAAAVVYWGYAAIANPAMGLLVLIGLSALLFWELQKPQADKQTPSRLPDTTHIAIFGLLLPMLLLGLIFGFAMPSTMPSAGEWWVLATVTPYIIGLSLWVATIFVRNPPHLTIRGMVSVLLALWSITYALSLDLRLGSALAALLILFWILWGSRRWRHYLWIHPSFGVVWVVLGGVIYLWTQAGAPAWVVLVGWLVAVAGLITWAFRR